MRMYKINIILTTPIDPPESLTWSQHIDAPSIFELYSSISAIMIQLHKPPRQPNDKAA